MATSSSVVAGGAVVVDWLVDAGADGVVMSACAARGAVVVVGAAVLDGAVVVVVSVALAATGVALGLAELLQDARSRAVARTSRFTSLSVGKLGVVRKAYEGILRKWRVNLYCCRLVRTR